MKHLPGEVSKAWENRKDAVVFSTTGRQGMPNSIYATCVSKYDDSTFLVVDNFFCKTKENILDGSKASILFNNGEGKSYQIKGSLQYFHSGEFFNDMKKWNPPALPGQAVAVLTVEEVYSGAKLLL